MKMHWMIAAGMLGLAGFLSSANQAAGQTDAKPPLESKKMDGSRELDFLKTPLAPSEPGRVPLPEEQPSAKSIIPPIGLPCPMPLLPPVADSLLSPLNGDGDLDNYLLRQDFQGLTERMLEDLLNAAPASPPLGSLTKPTDAVEQLVKPADRASPAAAGTVLKAEAAEVGLRAAPLSATAEDVGLSPAPPFGLDKNSERKIISGDDARKALQAMRVQSAKFQDDKGNWIVIWRDVKLANTRASDSKTGQVEVIVADLGPEYIDAPAPTSATPGNGTPPAAMPPPSQNATRPRASGK